MNRVRAGTNAVLRGALLPLIIAVGAALAGCRPAAAEIALTPAPSATATRTPAPSATPTITPAPSATPEPAATPAPTITLTPTLLPNAVTAGTAPRVELALTLGGEQGPFNAVAISGDGRLIATAGGDRAVYVFDGGSGELLHRLERHRGSVYTLDMTHDGSRLASGGRDRTVQLWVPGSGERITGSGTTAQLRQVAFSPDGRLLAGGGYFSALGEVWDSATGGSLYRLEGHETRLRSVVWSPDGTWLATGDEQGTVVIHDAATGRARDSFVAADAAVISLAVSPDGSIMAVGTSRNRVSLWDLAADERLVEWGPHTGGISGLAYSPDGSVLITAGGDGSVRLWEAARLPDVRDLHGLEARLITLSRHEGGCWGMDLSADGTTLVSAGEDGLVRVWRVLGPSGEGDLPAG